MNDETKKPSTEPYRGVRDFYPEDMVVQRYIQDTWSKVAESFGFHRYDASLLEPAELYRAKSSEEIVNDQTYTFRDRGDREVTLRPEMTPTVARMVAQRRRELAFPLRWYSIPNLFRYERAQRGRLREHWQLNCDIFGSHDVAADVEIIHLASSILTAFGAKDTDFEIRINDRATLFGEISKKIKDGGSTAEALKLLDSKAKISAEQYAQTESELFHTPLSLSPDVNSGVHTVLHELSKRGVTTASYDPSIVRGFTYYTGMVFEIFDTNPENRRSLLGGGRYDNLTGLFGGDPIPAVGFGMGDVTMRDFLETHSLLPATGIRGPVVYIVNDDTKTTHDAARIATTIRARGISAASNVSDKKLGDQLKLAERAGAGFALILSESDDTHFELKRLSDRTVTKVSLEECIATLLSELQ
jgi:histidyl-tRNA synthetase